LITSLSSKDFLSLLLERLKVHHRPYHHDEQHFLIFLDIQAARIIENDDYWHLHAYFSSFSWSLRTFSFYLLTL
jgi:hypothetical protein